LKKGWPPVLIVSGSEDFLRRRCVAELVVEANSTGRQVDRVEGKDPQALLAALTASEFMGTSTLILVSNPEKADLGVIKEHNAAGDNTAIILLHCEGNPKGNTKFGKMVKEMRKQHKSFRSPNSWERDKMAVAFCVKEAQNHGKTMSQQTAQAMVSVLGSDLGVLSFEVLKAATLADSSGSDEVGTTHLKKSMALVAEADVLPAIRALGECNIKRVLQALNRVKKTTKGDPTMRVCRVMGSFVLKWLEAANLQSLGVDSEEAAIQLGANDWYHRTKVLPPAMGLGQKRLVRLVHALAASERAVLNGHVAPWEGFQARLISAFEGS